MPQPDPPSPSAAKDSLLLNLPNELLILILDYHDFALQDLLELSFLCKRLHYVALSVFLARHQIPNPSEFLDLNSQNLHVLPILTRSLSFTSCRSLYCVLSPENLLRNLYNLEQLSSKISFYNATLYFLPRIAATPGGVDQRTVQAIRDVCASLFNSCQSLSVVSGILFPFRPPDTSGHSEFKLAKPPPQTKWAKLTQRFVSLKVNTLGSIKRSTTTMVHSKQEPAPENPLPLAKINVNTDIGTGTGTDTVASWRIKSFSIRSPVLLQPPFFDWMIGMLNESSLTTFSLLCMHLPVDAWAAALSAINIPTLTKLMIRVSSIDNIRILLDFLSRHPSISSMEIEGTVTFSTVTALNVFRPLLTSLECTPIGLDEDALSNLDVISIILYPNTKSDLVDTIFAMLARRTEDIALNLAFAGDIASQLSLSPTSPTAANGGCDNADSDGPPRIEASLHCVTSLLLRTSNLPDLSHEVISLISWWIALFPALRYVHFASSAAPKKAEDRTALVLSLGEACPKLKKVMIGWETYTVAGPG